MVSNAPLPGATQKSELEQIRLEIEASQNRIKRNRAEVALLRRESQLLKAESAQWMAKIRSTLDGIREIS